MGLDAYYQQLREYYDGAKYRYDYESLRKQIHDEPASGFGIAQPMFDSARQLLAGRNVIDLGCGIGKWCRALAPVANMTGVDFSPHFIEIARDGTRATNVTYVADDVLTLANLQGTFDGAIHFNVFNHVPWADWSRFIRTLHSKLRPGLPVIMGAQRFDSAVMRCKELTWIDDVPDPVQHNVRDGRVYHVVENTFDEALIRTVFENHAVEPHVELIPPPSSGKCGAWYATYRMP